jgi:two-component system, chemotaxis family, chemotaxis protein CheY
MNILIADDAGFICEMLTNIVEEAGHQVVGIATNGAEVIELANKIRPDLILMDLVLPDQNGLEAAAEIYKTQPQMKIIACSSLEGQWIEEKIREAGLQYFVKKPFVKEDVLTAIRFTFKDDREIKNG